MFYVITLYSGENEFINCCESVSTQTSKNKHEIIEGLNSIDAHKELYSRFSNVSDEHLFLCKIDADMIFNDVYVLQDISLYFDSHLNVDHIVLPVHDFFTNSHIIGIHFYRKGVFWNDNSDSFFVDHRPIAEGKKITLPWLNRVTHCSRASINQSFLFGLHRMTKFQEAINTINIIQVVSQYDTLVKTIANLKMNPNDKNLKYSVLGVSSVISGDYSHSDYKDKSTFIPNINNEFETDINIISRKLKNILYSLPLKARLHIFIHFFKKNILYKIRGF
jgi:hypothetical protein